MTLKAVLSLNKKVDKQNSHSNVEQNHHDNQDGAVGLRGREKREKSEHVSNKDTHMHTKLTYFRLFSYRGATVLNIGLLKQTRSNGATVKHRIY